jgi:hypothetical protein
MADNPLLSSRDPQRNPFADASGKNPFADDGAPPPLPTAENPYASSLTPGMPAEHIAPFETTQVSRGRLLLALCGLGWFAFVLAAAGWLRNSGWGIPPGLIAAVLGVITLLLAGHDLSAIAAGAMEPSGKRATESAYWLAVLEVLLLCALTGIFFWQQFEPTEV